MKEKEEKENEDEEWKKKFSTRNSLKLRCRLPNRRNVGYMLFHRAFRKISKINVQSSLRTALDSIEYRKPMPPTNGAILIRPSYAGNRITRIVELDVNEIYKSVLDFREILARNARERSNLREN